MNREDLKTDVQMCKLYGIRFFTFNFTKKTYIKTSRMQIRIKIDEIREIIIFHCANNLNVWMSVSFFL